MREPRSTSRRGWLMNGSAPRSTKARRGPSATPLAASPRRCASTFTPRQPATPILRCIRDCTASWQLDAPHGRHRKGDEPQGSSPYADRAEQPGLTNVWAGYCVCDRRRLRRATALAMLPREGTMAEERVPSQRPGVVIEFFSSAHSTSNIRCLRSLYRGCLHYAPCMTKEGGPSGPPLARSTPAVYLAALADAPFADSIPAAVFGVVTRSEVPNAFAFAVGAATKAAARVPLT
jgi:hypothetical protein